MTYNKQFKMKLTTLEKDFLDDVELEILDQELRGYKNLLDSMEFDYQEDSGPQKENDREFTQLFQLNNEIIIDLYLSLKCHLEPGEQSDYELFGVILWDHTAYIKKGQNWYLHEEDEITEVTQEEVEKNKWPYMLFYKRLN